MEPEKGRRFDIKLILVFILKFFEEYGENTVGIT